ncbi:flagellar hook assembly protein FlgD [Thiomicrospira sp. ALE5]|uniref:flagellar hook assembly protein FlgD n=1 Tax=Thiomicrospira sp. ALE5 TaxID=748650 RepID=UPI0008EAA0D6|nr:flagellar hook capping FlgD N-terminal domain-containing protein [Thiomicrospira sp. ALE5]SFR51035.1 flagellar basal-body rod modification protein FlgD [Thiomicrospira sp. ALE5]
MNTLPISTGVKESLSTPSNAGAFAPSQEMGQKEFLMLLTTQLMNQDPTQPMDPTAFVSDLTQMSQLEATTELNRSVMAMTAGFQNLQLMQASSLIGKNVQAQGEVMSHTEGQASGMRLSTDQSLSNVQIVITDNRGVVRQLDYPGLLNSGETGFSWDGLDNNGSMAPSNNYRVVAFGFDGDGEIQPVKTVLGTQVQSVSVEPDGDMLLTLSTGERVSMKAVREIGG